MDAELKEAVEFARTLGVTRIVYESRHGGRVEVEFDQRQMVESAIPEEYTVSDNEGVSEEDLLFYSAGGR
jgi:hypothetical protein